MQNSLQDLSTQFVTLANKVCTERVNLGDVVITMSPPNQWGPSWAEPNGQLLDQVTYAELFAIFGSTYGSGAGTFALPDLVSGNRFLKPIPVPGNVVATGTGGSNAFTLAETNIPIHDHVVTGNTTSNGQHTHAIPTRSSNGGANSCRTGDDPTLKI